MIELSGGFFTNSKNFDLSNVVEGKNVEEKLHSNQRLHLNMPLILHRLQLDQYCGFILSAYFSSLFSDFTFFRSSIRHSQVQQTYFLISITNCDWKMNKSFMISTKRILMQKLSFKNMLYSQNTTRESTNLTITYHATLNRNSV